MATKSRVSKVSKPGFHCTECGWTCNKWVGKCGECHSWGTVTEAIGASSGPKTAPASTGNKKAVPINEIDSSNASTIDSGIQEFDRVLGGGLVPGSLVLLTGEPGAGKSTLLLSMAAAYARQGKKVLYITAEESAAQVHLRARRIGALAEGLLLSSETDLGICLGHIVENEPDILIVDSVQTIASSEVEGGPGGIAQVKEVIAALINVAKNQNLPTILVGHVTKDGSVAGPRTLEHLVDVVCQFEGDRHARLRLLRAIKNRYGPTDEVGCFEITDTQMREIADPSGIFISQHQVPASGTCITVTLEGRRPLPLEIQSLVVPTALNNPRRTTNGIESSRLAMLIAVCQKHLGVKLHETDIYAATVGGAKVSEPSIDLPLALAILSALSDTPLPKELVAFGEIGLAGELRNLNGIQRRLLEAKRLGCKIAIVPAGSEIPKIPEMKILQANSLAEASNMALTLIQNQNSEK